MKTAKFIPIGGYLGGTIMEYATKYDFQLSDAIVHNDVNRLTNQIWKLIPMREHEENWRDQLISVIIEVSGLNEILITEPDFLVLLSKLEGLMITELDFKIYRKTVFESISLLRGLIDGRI